MGILTTSQGKVRELSGNFDSRIGYEPCESEKQKLPNVLM